MHAVDTTAPSRGDDHDRIDGVGDVSILFALAWAFDGVLIAVALGVGLGILVGTSISTLLALAIPVMVAFAVWGGMRGRRLQA